MKKRVLAVLLAAVLAFGLLPVTAGAANGAQKVVDAANKYCNQGATAYTFGFSADWCGSFLYYIANEAGEGAAMGGSDYMMRYNPRSMNWFIDTGAKVGYFYDALPANTEAHLSGSQRMNKSDCAPQLGDIIYFDWDGYGNGGLYHVEIVTAVSGRNITTVGGNAGSGSWNQTKVTRRSASIDWPYIVAFARPNYSNNSAQSNTTTSGNGGTTKTQYRYHRYVDDNGEYAVCAYWGNVTYNTVMHLEYSSWLDSPLPEVKKGYQNYLEHPNQGASCTNAGCLPTDPFEVHRYEDAGGKVWYYEETRTVTVNDTSAPAPSPTPTPTPTPEPTPNCDEGHTWGDWTVATEPACEKAGVRERTCELCGEKEGELLEALGHDYQAKQETETAVLYVCANCGDSYMEEKETPAGNGDNFSTKRSYRTGLFSDVKGTDWFVENVRMAYELALMEGVGEGRFAPRDNVTLAQAVTMAARIHKIYHTGKDEFSAYDSGNWYDPYVDYARANGIIYENYTYNRPATREEFVHILAAALPEEEFAAISGAAKGFSDDNDITYLRDVSLLREAGVINGTEEGGKLLFKPWNTITRAEAAAIITRLVKPELRKG